MIVRFSRRRNLAAGFTTALLLLFAPAAFSQTETGTIQGTANWVIPTLDANGKLQFDGSGNVIGIPCKAMNWKADYKLDFSNCVETLTQTFCLTAAAGSTALTNADLKRWETNMESVWSTDAIQILCGSPTGNKTWHLRYDSILEIGGANSMYNVTVHDGDGPTNTDDWYRETTSAVGVDNPNNDVVAHETGHYLANPDEYTIGCVDRKGANVAPAFTTDSLMNNTKHGKWVYKPRHFTLWEVALENADSLAGRQGLRYSVFAVPEPSTFAMLLAIAVPGASLLLRRKRPTKGTVTRYLA